MKFKSNARYSEPVESDTLMSAIKESKEVLKKTIESLRKDIDSFCESEIEISRY